LVIEVARFGGTPENVRHWMWLWVALLELVEQRGRHFRVWRVDERVVVEQLWLARLQTDDGHDDAVWRGVGEEHHADLGVATRLKVALRALAVGVNDALERRVVVGEIADELVHVVDARARLWLCKFFFFLFSLPLTTSPWLSNTRFRSLKNALPSASC
jgi:hypothetical protein